MPFFGVLEPFISGSVAPVAPAVHALEWPSVVVVLIHVVGKVLHEIERVIARKALETECWLIHQVEVDGSHSSCKIRIIVDMDRNQVPTAPC